MTGGAGGHAGGVERQTTALARWLAQRGFDASLVVWDEGQPPSTVIDGVRVIAMCSPHAGVRGLRFFHPRWTSLARALREADADLYYHNCAEYITGQVAWWCRRHQRRFVYSVASDPECDPRLPMLPHLRERALFRYGLRHADRIIVQTDRQHDRLRRDWGLDSVVLKMPVTFKPGPLPAGAPGGQSRVVWVGRISAEKRLDRLLAIAAQLPQTTFDIAGGVDAAFTAGHSLIEQARTRQNVRVLGQIARDRMPAVYEGATCLLCTSDYEGFPNTFLEAWTHGVPVVSTIDPDGLIASERLGYTNTTDAGLARHIAHLDATPEERTAIGRRAQGYVDRHHSPESALVAFEHTFRDVIAGARGR
jgi:glycosyltransferase involved in cell wall biosynthesis